MGPHVTPACNNSLTLGKPLDPRLLLNPDPGVNNICEKSAAPVLFADWLLVAQDLLCLNKLWGCGHPKFCSTAP
ncbi:hypothetical protein V6N13_041421 [Hibiscus sabdariffa]